MQITFKALTTSTGRSHEHKYLERRIYPAKFIEGRTTVPPDERQTELVIDNSFPAGLETPEELLQ